MLDEHNRIGDNSMISSAVPVGSIKGQFENLITTLGFEAHKAEALLADNSDQDMKKFDQMYSTIQEKLN
jgi:hypothetical protein